MSLGWHDLRRTVRRRGADAPAQVYPFLLRDERLYPRLGLAIDYFESMVGRPRAELDSEVLVQFFADHRLARGVVASLAGHYGYRRQGFADALDAPTRERLAAQGLQRPADLRAALYADVNQHDGGFAADAARTAALARLADRVDLPPDAVEALLVLDAEDRAPLVRLAPMPTPAEVAAIYNHLVADAVLRAAARIDLELAAGGRGKREGAASFVDALAGQAALAGLPPEAVSAHDGEGMGERADEGGAEDTGERADGVAAEGTVERAGGLGTGGGERGSSRATPRQVTLRGEQDAFGSWSRHGRRLARALGRTLSRHPGSLRGGSVLVEARGGPYACALNANYVQALVGPPAPAPAPPGDAPAPPAPSNNAPVPPTELCWNLRPELAVLRRRGEADGWSLRNWPPALVYPEGVLFPDFALTAGALSIHVVVADTPALATTTARLAPRLAVRGDVLLAAPAALAAPLRPLGLPLAELPNPPAPFPAKEGGTGGSLLRPGPMLRRPASPPAQPAPPFLRRVRRAILEASLGRGGLGLPLATVLAVARTLAPCVAPAVATSLDRVLAAVREAGFVPTEHALLLAAYAEEAELAGRLAAAGVEDVRLVPGVGLHTEAFLRRLREAPAVSGVA